MQSKYQSLWYKQSDNRLFHSPNSDCASEKVAKLFANIFLSYVKVYNHLILLSPFVCVLY